MPNLVLCLCFLILGSTPGFCRSQEQCQKICGNFEETENARDLVKEQNYRQLKTINITNDDTRFVWGTGIGGHGFEVRGGDKPEDLCSNNDVTHLETVKTIRGRVNPA